MDHNPVHIDRPKYICVCRNVTRQDIRNAIREKGARTIPDLIRITRASTGCGTCALKVRTIFEEELEELRDETEDQKILFVSGEEQNRS